jgi:hypothetical protein
MVRLLAKRFLDYSRKSGLIIIFIPLIIHVISEMGLAMCRYILDVFDVDKLESKKKNKLTKHLEGRKKVLQQQIDNIDRALKAVKKKGKA